MKIRTLIVDDEPHAREGISLRLKEYSQVEIVGECSSGREAVKAINTLHPDLVFLDIQMPEMTGIEVVRQCSPASSPIVIFVTAYDKYAVKAFEYHALDYLLKPISDDRFRDTMKIALTEIGHKNLEKYTKRLRAVVNDYLSGVDAGVADEATVPLPAAKVPAANYLSRLMIKSKDSILVLPVEEIEWIEAAGDYVYIRANAHKYMIRETLSSLIEKLDPNVFVRIHRSVIVSAKKIKTLRQNEHGDYDVFLEDGTKLKMSRTYRESLQSIVGNAP
jgi:two-component system LytT family response regulator